MKSVTIFIKQFKVMNALKKSNCYKEKGISIHDIFCYLVQIVYTGKGMHMSYKTESYTPKLGKDVVYRFLNSMYINWQAFLLKLSGTIINEHLANLTSEKRINAIIIDDSFYGRLRSKNVELLSNVNDHASTGIQAKHVLFDSWLSYPVTIIRIFKLKLHTVGRLKNTTKIKCIFEGERKTLTQIYDDSNNILDVRIVFVRDRNNKKKWIAIISTDLSISKEVIALYVKRKNMGYSFKVCKFYLVFELLFLIFNGTGFFDATLNCD